MSKLKPEVKKAWTTALRSGEYEQTSGRLMNDHEESPAYCCLGVLCDLSKTDLHKSWRFGAANVDYATFDGESTMVPKSVLDWAGMDPESNFNEDDDTPADEYSPEEFNELANMNDSGANFEEIAKWINKNL